MFQIIGNVIEWIQKDALALIKQITEANAHLASNLHSNLGIIYLMTADLSQAKTHFKRAFKIHKKIWTDEPEMIEKKYKEIQELYPQVGFFLGQQISNFLTE